MTRDGFSCFLSFQFFSGEDPHPPPSAIFSQHSAWLEVRYSSRGVKKIFLVFFPSFFFVNNVPGFLLVFSKMLLESLLTHLVSKVYELIGRVVMHQSFVSTHSPPTGIAVELPGYGARQVLFESVR